MKFNRRRFVASLLATPAAPIASSFAFTQDDPPVTRKEVSDEILRLSVKAQRIPSLPIYSVLTMLSSALERNDEADFAAHCVKYDFPEARKEGKEGER